MFQETPSADFLRPLGDYVWQHTCIKKSTCRDICYNELSELFWKLYSKVTEQPAAAAVSGDVVGEDAKLEAVTAALNSLCVGASGAAEWSSSDFWKWLKERLHVKTGIKKSNINRFLGDELLAKAEELERAVCPLARSPAAGCRLPPPTTPDKFASNDSTLAGAAAPASHEEAAPVLNRLSEKFLKNYIAAQGDEHWDGLRKDLFRVRDGKRRFSQVGGPGLGCSKHRRFFCTESERTAWVPVEDAS